MNEFLATLRDGWDRLVGFVRTMRAPRRREVDPSTLAPTAAPDDRGMVVARADDGILDVVDRIEAAGMTEVVLMVPREARSLRDPAAWPHIAAVAKRNSLALGVVAARGDVRGYARQNGLPTAASVQAVVRSPHHRLRLGDREFYVPRMAWGGLIRAAVLGMGLYVVAIVACNTIPSAEIVIVPASEEMTASGRLRLSPIASEPDLELGIQPATSFDHTFTHSIAILTTGEVEVPDQRATVMLQFSNASEVERTVRAGTQIDDENGISFATDEDVAVPAASIATVSSTAIQPGTQANVPFATLILTSDLPQGVTVTNPASASGGTDVFVPAVDETDVVRVVLIADEMLRRIGERELLEAVTDGTVFPQTISVQIFSQESLSNPGDPAEIYLVDYTAVVSALVVTEADAQLTGRALLTAQLPKSRELLLSGANVVLSDARIEGGTMTVLVEATGLVADVVDTALVSAAVKGDSPGPARAEIQEMLGLETPPRIELNPGFIPWRWLPRNSGRISVTFAVPGTEAALEEAGDDEDGNRSTVLSSFDAVATATAEPSAAPIEEP